MVKRQTSTAQRGGRVGEIKCLRACQTVARHATSNRVYARLFKKENAPTLYRFNACGAHILQVRHKHDHKIIKPYGLLCNYTAIPHATSKCELAVAVT